MVSEARELVTQLSGRFRVRGRSGDLEEPAQIGRDHAVARADADHLAGKFARSGQGVGGRPADAQCSGSDREARRTAWENYTDTFLNFRNTLASNLSTSINQMVFRTRARRYSSTLEASKGKARRFSWA